MSRNTVSSFLLVFGWIILIAGTIASYYYARSPVVPSWQSEFMKNLTSTSTKTEFDLKIFLLYMFWVLSSGLFFIGISEIINLLDRR